MTHSLLVFSLAVGLIQATSQAQPTPAGAQPTMTVDDVIKMVQVKLADDLIISQIRKNGKPFSLSADDMVRLKTTGASDNVIRVMIDPQAPEPPRAPGAANAVPAVTAASPLPSAYGYYIRDEHKMSDLGQVQVITKVGLPLGDRGPAVDGLSDQTPLLRVDSQSPTIIVYQQNVQPNALQLSALSFVRNMKAYQFNILGTAPQFFSNIYKKDPNETIPIDLWRPSRNVQLRVEPVEGKTGMYKVVPAAQLEVGKYALYFPDSLHADDIVFTASVGRQSAVLAFEVVPGNSPTAAPNGDSRPQLTGGVLYLAKSDHKMAVVHTEVANFGWQFGARQIVHLNGPKAAARFTQHDKTVLLVSTPVMGWRDTNTYRVYPFEVKNDKRTVVLNKPGISCSIETFGATSQFVQIVPGVDLKPGEYVFIPTNITVPPIGGLKVGVFTFGIDPETTEK
jgi:hypothetical protein